jgi:hypothetical protein
LITPIYAKIIVGYQAEQIELDLGPALIRQGGRLGPWMTRVAASPKIPARWINLPDFSPATCDAPEKLNWRVGTEMTF